MQLAWKAKLEDCQKSAAATPCTDYIGYCTGAAGCIDDMLYLISMQHLSCIEVDSMRDRANSVSTHFATTSPSTCCVVLVSCYHCMFSAAAQGHQRMGCEIQAR